MFIAAFCTSMKAKYMAAAIVALLLNAGADVRAQTMVTTAPGAQYSASAAHEFWFGSGYRLLWETPVRVPVLDLSKAAGGLKPVKEGGGKQTRTLHLRGQDGREYVFRSMDKYLDRVVPSRVMTSLLGPAIQDETALFNPSGALIVPRLAGAVNVLHVQPKVYVMPNDARLGEFRAAFAGMLGYLEERPEESEKDAGFAGSKRIVGTEKLDAHRRDDSRNRVDERDWLAARMLDFLVGDTDRGGAQWRWARFEDDGLYRWRPIPRDRDFAFIHADGVFPWLVGRVYKRLVLFEDRLPPFANLTFSTMHLDRAYLQSLDGAAWAAITTQVQQQLSNTVIDAAVRGLPPEHYALEGPRIASALRSRRAELTRISRRLYTTLAEQVDVQGSDAAERVEISRSDDGSVEVRMYRMEAAAVASLAGAPPISEKAIYQRRFLPAETREVRIYLYGGNDRATVSGSNVRQAIEVRVIGGDGNDVLLDSSVEGPGSAHTWFYDDSGANRFETNRHTRVDRRGFIEPDYSNQPNLEGRHKRYRDWGDSHAITPLLDYRSNTGFITGVQYSHKEYGFRRVPYESRWRARLLWAPTDGSFGAQLDAEEYFENSAWNVFGRLRASGFDNLRFYGYGNDTPDIDTDSAMVDWTRYQAIAGLRYETDVANFGIGGAMQISDTPIEAGTPLDRVDPLGTGDWTQYGVWAEAGTRLVDGNARLALEGAYYPAIASLNADYGKARGTAVAYIGSAPTLALRAIGEKIWGDAPFHDAAFIGGRKLLRGYSSYRFAGDASLLGNAELRMPVGKSLGVFVLGDAGRVYVDGDSPGDWHTAFGGGLWVRVAGHDITGTYAHGEDHKVYITLDRAF